MYDNIYDDIASQVKDAAREQSKMVMFHFQVLTHAEALNDDDPVEFCRRIDVPETYATEFRKMLNLARLMRRQGVALTKQ